MKNIRILFAALLISSAVLLASCESTTNPITQTNTFTDSTLFSLSEGGFGSSNSQLDAYSLKTNTLTSDIIPNLGDVGNDIQLFGKRLYVLVENSNKIVSINPDSTADRISIQFLTGAEPSKMAQVSSDEVWVTEFTKKQIAVMNPSTNSISSTPIDLDASQLDIAVLGTKAFVITNSNALEVIDISTKTVISNKYIGDSPAQIFADKAHNSVIVLTYGNYAPHTDGKILWVDAGTYNVTDSITTDSTKFINALIPAGDKAYITYATETSKLDLSTHKISLFRSTIYYKGIFDETTNRLIIGRGDFSAPGSVDIYEASTGNLFNSFSAGIYPGHFVIYRK